MTTYDEARALAENEISSISTKYEIILLEDHVVETPEAWYFPYNSREYVENGSISAALAGNHPVRVPKDGGDVRLESPSEWKSS